MGFLTEEDFKQSSNIPPPKPKAAPSVTQTAPIPEPVNQNSTRITASDVFKMGTGTDFNKSVSSPQPDKPFAQRAEDKLLEPFFKKDQDRFDNFKNLPKSKTDEQINEEFGGPIGSEAYYRTKSEDLSGAFARSLQEGLGLQLPPPEVWDQLGYVTKQKELAKAAQSALAQFVVKLPRQIVMGPMSLNRTLFDTVGAWSSSLATGKSFKESRLQEQKDRLPVPIVGSAPSWYETYDEARASGLNKWEAGLVTGNKAFGDVTITASLADALQSSFKPRIALKPNEAPVFEPKSINKNIKAEVGEMKAARGELKDSPSSYRSVSVDQAKKYGGNPNNTFVKITPADATGTKLEISVVQTRKGVMNKIADTVLGKERSGVRKGAMGDEIVLESNIIDIEPGFLPEGAKPNASQMASNQKSGPVITVDEIGTPKPSSILPAPLKGMENRPITNTELSNLGQIVNETNIGHGVAYSLMKTVTGKSVASDMTHSEYVQYSQAVNAFSKVVKPGEIFVGNAAAQKVSPPKNWMSRAEQDSGFPIYSEGYVPLQNGKQFQRQYETPLMKRVDDFFGDYAGVTKSNERRLINNYIEGDKGAIENNAKLTPEEKVSLVKIADETKTLLEELRVSFGADKRQDYQSHIKFFNEGSKRYKDTSGMPETSDPFFLHERKGGIGERIDDALVLLHTYIRSGSNKMFLEKPLELANKVYSKLPESLKQSYKDQVQETMGYQGATERFMDEMVPKINKKMGLNLPPDAAKSMVKIMMDTTYSGAMGFSPSSVAKNILQSQQSYARFGLRNFVKASQIALTEEGRQAVIDAGLAVDMGIPYGRELLDQTATENPARAAYSKFVQASLKPQGLADLTARATVYHHGKLLWDEAVAKNFKGGKSDINGFESDMDFRSLSPVDRNIIRKALVKGDEKAAFNHFIRDALDETQGAYRTGTQPEFMRGLTGKVMGQFGQWGVNQMHMLGGWTRKGQWDKLIRYFAAATVTKRTLEDTVGLNITDWVGVKTLLPTASPAIQIASSSAGWAKNAMDKNYEEVEKNKDDVIRSLKSLGVPAGVQANRFKSFLRSYESGVQSDGKYIVFSENGTDRRHATFKDLFYGMFGMPTTEKIEDRETDQAMKNVTFNKAKAKEKAMQLWQQEKYDQASEIMKEFNIKVTADDFNKFHIPYNQRSFNSLPADSKANFYKRVFTP